jgi:D-lactate dehydrogenase (cytochrome)
MNTTSFKRLRTITYSAARPSRPSSSCDRVGNELRRRFASTRPVTRTQASTTNDTLRGVLAGAGLSLGIALIAYRTGVISLPGESAHGPLTAEHCGHEEVQKAISELREAFHDNQTVVTEQTALQTYGSSPNSYHPTSPHSVVVHVKSTEDVVKVVNIARKYRVPIVAYSGATSLEGHFSGVSVACYYRPRYQGSQFELQCRSLRVVSA